MIITDYHIISAKPQNNWCYIIKETRPWKTCGPKYTHFFIFNFISRVTLDKTHRLTYSLNNKNEYISNIVFFFLLIKTPFAKHALIYKFSTSKLSFLIRSWKISDLYSKSMIYCTGSYIIWIKVRPFQLLIRKDSFGVESL